RSSTAVRCPPRTIVYRLRSRFCPCRSELLVVSWNLALSPSRASVYQTTSARFAVTLIGRGERSSRRHARRSIVVFLRPARSVMQEGVAGVRFVTRADRKGGHRCGVEEVRADSDANRCSCGFGSELADRRITHRSRVDCHPQRCCLCFPPY